MSSAAQTLNKVSRLLGELPGVTISATRIAGQDAIFEITCHGAPSARLVQRLCEAANAVMEPPVRLHNLEFGAESARPFSLSASIEGFDQIEFGCLQLLGIHLVWHLHRAGAMPLETADQLLQQWNGARVGA